MYELTVDQAANRTAYEAFVRRIATAVTEIATRHGMVADDVEDRAESRYLGVWTVEDDGCRGDRVASVRISDHSQRYGGPDWSFEPRDSEASIARGLTEIERLCLEW